MLLVRVKHISLFLRIIITNYDVAFLSVCSLLTVNVRFKSIPQINNLSLITRLPIGLSHNDNE